MIDHFTDASLKRWARWCQIRMIDKSMGYPKSSPVSRFGMPRTGSVFDMIEHFNYEINEESEQLHMIIFKTLDEKERQKLKVYYIQTHCRLRVAAKILDMTHPTLSKHLAFIVSKIRRAIAEERDTRKLRDNLSTTNVPNA